MELCPCGTGKEYALCCGRFIEQQEYPATPEELMRSRYSAYTRLNLDYIARTMKGPAARSFNAQEALAWARRVSWLRLEVLAAGSEGDRGSVEFQAYYRDQGQEACLHEKSEFRLEGRQWYYVDGHSSRSGTQPVASAKIPRNDPCSCGSGRKYKKCCGA